jgi:hypothetical protein
MRTGFRSVNRGVATIGLLCSLACFAAAQNSTKAQAASKPEAMVTRHATGTFEVKLIPQTPDEQSKAAGVGRMSIDKQFHGGLEGTSKGEMLSFGTGEKGSSGGYVALEQFTGTLDGRSGSFVLQHSATMNRGMPQLTIAVVPDSGTGQLAGLTGKLNITITDGKHSYDFEYALPETH